ncbi:YigZ family protein [Agarivorans albus]|uniref:Protein co-occurring with transport systems n=1 Tax=Agarivorans albus MKT 106 TaxID=1331007 RepID=R9PH05_AGAAL|nr:protein co-occurring with transport systems [Agarivorans albus MKT 106]
MAIAVNDYFKPQQTVSCEELIKHSRFISLIIPVANRQQAQQQLVEIKQLHPQARHHCWAFVAGHPNDSQCLGFSDDGEPSGTAGKPMLAQLQGSGLGQILAVVVRYSGGIKLGTGGLVKAYGGGVQQALKLVESERVVACGECGLEFDYAYTAQVESMLERHQAVKLDTQFSSLAQMQVSLPLSEYAAFKQQLINLSSGQIKVGKLLS